MAPPEEGQAASDGRRPWTKWFWQDYLGDPQVSQLSSEAERCWFRILGLIELRGKDGSVTVTIERLARFLARDIGVTRSVLDELDRVGVATLDLGEPDSATITSRRIQRDSLRRSGDAARQRRNRVVVSRASHGDVTPMSRQCHSRVPEARGQRPETRGQTPQKAVRKVGRERASSRRSPDHVEPATAAVDVVGAVYETYRTYHKATPRVVAPKHHRLIAARLKEGFPADVLELAIHGNHCDPHCCGENERNKTYHSLDLILRDADHVTGYLESLVRHGRPDLAERARALVGDQPEASGSPPRRPQDPGLEEIRRYARIEERLREGRAEPGDREWWQDYHARKKRHPDSDARSVFEDSIEESGQRRRPEANGTPAA